MEEARRTLIVGAVDILFAAKTFLTYEDEHGNDVIVLFGDDRTEENGVLISVFEETTGVAVTLDELKEALSFMKFNPIRRGVPHAVPWLRNKQDKPKQ